MTTCKSVLEIAIRLESAYDKKFVYQDKPIVPNPDLWIRCAVGIITLHQSDCRYPKDPELFIALQPISGFTGVDFEAVLDSLIVHYAKSVRRMIRKLRREIALELKYLHRISTRNVTPETLILSRSLNVTPLSRYIFAQIHGWNDLAESLLGLVLEQHEVCPLYRHASSRWLDDRTYPSIRSLEHWHRPTVSPEAGWDVMHN